MDRTDLKLPFGIIRWQRFPVDGLDKLIPVCCERIGGRVRPWIECVDAKSSAANSALRSNANFASALIAAARKQDHCVLPKVTNFDSLLTTNYSQSRYRGFSMFPILLSSVVNKLIALDEFPGCNGFKLLL